ncbi:MAG: hypothetical protein HYV32_02160 [Candidatus Kerfeldbacteria bacterium]|nr:hypothetical protein [Candidatus Kerfeldbacteria bacterium]
MDHIENYIQKIHSALRGGSTVRISSFVDEHAAVLPVLHPHVRAKKADISALIYSILRLPSEILLARSVIMGQSDRVFEQVGIQMASKQWLTTKAIARERQCAYNKRTSTIAVFVASISDVEDLITILTAFYIEVQKLHQQLQEDGITLADCFSPEDYSKLQEVLSNQWKRFETLVAAPIDYELKLLAGSSVDYSKTVQQWWIHIASSRKEYPFDVYKQPVYFVSSNSHSLINTLSGFPLKNAKMLFADNAEFLEKNAEAFAQEHVPKENICSYLSRFTQRRNPQFMKDKLQYEKKQGLIRLKPYHHIDIEAQIFSIRDVITNKWLDPRLKINERMRKQLIRSNALIVNIAYPLGMGAYSILREVSENVPEVRGVYIMGKCASLNASIGDITIPHYVRDLHTKNQMFVNNIFSSDTFAPYVEKNSVLTNQKAVSVRGTFLQNEHSLQQDYKDGYTIVEMEAGPYLNRVYEMIYPERYPTHSTVVLDPDFRLGLAYYVSDTPHKKGLNLGAKRLTWEGLNGTYAISLGILRDIFSTEAGQSR